MVLTMHELTALVVSVAVTVVALVFVGAAVLWQQEKQLGRLTDVVAAQDRDLYELRTWCIAAARALGGTEGDALADVDVQAGPLLAEPTGVELDRWADDGGPAHVEIVDQAPVTDDGPSTVRMDRAWDSPAARVYLEDDVDRYLVARFTFAGGHR